MTIKLNVGGLDLYLKRTDLTVPGGVQYVYHFPNGYGGSIVKFPGSYGYKEDLWELAVIVFDDEGDYELAYDTPITADVEGYLTDKEVENLLYKIKGL